MTTEPRFVPWKGKEIMEKGLPAGVRYRCKGHHPDTVLIALQGGGRVFEFDGISRIRWVTDSGIRRPDTPVTIIDWPDDCGPRPDDKPTWIDIIDNAPSPGAWTVFEREDGSRYHHPVVRGLARGGDTPPHTFLGWFDLGGRAQ